MKILEAQSATLTNFEVYTHLKGQKVQYETRSRKRRGPGNLETVVKELLDYLQTAPSPLAETPIPYTNDTVRVLLDRLRPFELTKAEILMILNHRPTRVASLNTIVEELEQRYPSHKEQRTMVTIIKEVLGSPDQGEELESMTNNAKSARDKEDRQSRDHAHHGTMDTKDD